MSEVVLRRSDLENFLKAISKVRDEIEAIQEELEILLNDDLVKKIEDGLNDVREGNIYSLDEFRKVVRE